MTREKPDSYQGKKKELFTNDVLKASLSDRELVLPFTVAIEAIRTLKTAGVLVSGWEGWILHPDGGVGHSKHFMGTIPFHPKPGQSAKENLEQAANFVQETITADHTKWEKSPEVRGGELFFCLFFNAD